MYAKIKDNTVVQYPYGLDNLYVENPHTNFGIVENLVATFATTENGVDGHTLVEVKLVQPIVDHTKNFTEGTPSLVDSIWIQTWVTSDASQEEIDSRVASKIVEVQQEITRLKAGIPSNVSEQQQIFWELYSMQLDLVSQQTNYPWRITWPNKPL